jgi:hypothetical protein
LNDKVLPLFVAKHLPMLRILTHCGSEYCGWAESHDYQLHLPINDIERSNVKVKSFQTKSFWEHFHKTMLQESYQLTFLPQMGV